MATGDNKQAVSNSDDGEAPKIKVGGSNTNQRQIPALQAVSRRNAIIGILVLALLAIFLIKVLHVGQKVYAQAAGHKIYKQDVKNLIGNTKGVSDRQAATVLADKYLTQAMAKEQHITITNKDIESVNGSDPKKMKTAHPYAYQLGLNQWYFDQLQAYNRGIYKGTLLVAQFSRFIPARPLTAQDKAAFPQFGNPTAIAADKEYAKGFITNLYNNIQSGKMTWDQAIQAEHNDPTLGLGAYPSLSHSGPFDTSKVPQPLFVAQSAQEQVSKIKPGQTSKPFAVSVNTSISDQPVDSYYLVVHMDSAKGGQSIGFEKYISESKKKYNYHVYV